MAQHRKPMSRRAIVAWSAVPVTASAILGATVFHVPEAGATAHRPATYTRVISRVPTWHTLAYAPTEDSTPRNAHGTLAYRHAKWYDRRTGQVALLGPRPEADGGPDQPRDPCTGLFLDYRHGAWVAQR